MTCITNKHSNVKLWAGIFRLNHLTTQWHLGQLRCQGQDGIQYLNNRKWIVVEVAAGLCLLGHLRQQTWMTPVILRYMICYIYNSSQQIIPVGTETGSSTCGPIVMATAIPSSF